MPQSRIVVGSHNLGKVREIREWLADLNLEVASLADFPEAEPIDETGSTFTENATLKATGLARRLQTWVLADDSGLEVDALEGRPGVYSARYGGEGLSDAGRAAKLLDALQGVSGDSRTARFRCVAVLADPERVRCVTRGTVEGRIADSPSGSSGFGYDPVFVPEGFDRTFAELGMEVKQRLSHRARAMADMVGCLKPLLEAGDL